MAPTGGADGRNRQGLTIKQLGQLPKAMEQPLDVIGVKRIQKSRSFGWDAELQLLGSIPENGYIRTIPQTAANVKTRSTQGGGKDATGKQFSVEQDRKGGTEDESTTTLVESTNPENGEISGETVNSQDGDDATTRMEGNTEESLTDQGSGTEAPTEKRKKG